MRNYIYTIALINELVRPEPCFEQEARVRKKDYAKSNRKNPNVL